MRYLHINKKVRWMIIIVLVIILASLFLLFKYVDDERTVQIEQETVQLITYDNNNEYNGEAYQFPEAGKTVDGDIYVTFSGLGHRDTSQGYENERMCFITSNEGESWNKLSFSELAKADILMPNGNYFQGAIPQNSYEASWLENYRSAYTDGNISYYRACEIDEYVKTVSFREYNPKTKEFIDFQGNISWDNMPVVVEKNRVLPINAICYLANYYYYQGNIYMIIYCRGFDNKNGQPTNGQYNIYIFVSTDSARNWEYVTQILAIDNESIADTVGYSEPYLINDGTHFFILLRTGAGQSIYSSLTSDITNWSVPYKFNCVGVKPQLLLLDDGILVASYGRPGIFVKASRDKNRVIWSSPYIIDNRTKSASEAWEYSCCYTSMVSVSKNELLIFYTDFKYQINGKECKAVLCQKLRLR